MKQYIFLVLGLFITVSSSAQGLGLTMMNNVGQINLTNPANNSNKRFYLGVTPYAGLGTSFAGANAYAINTGLLSGIGFGVDINELSDQNFIMADVQVVPLAIGFKRGKWSLNTHLAFNTNFHLNFPKEFLGLLLEGNAPYIGQTINLDPDINISSYTEIGVGINREFLNFLTVGARVKFLSGIMDLRTTSSDLTLETKDEFYQLAANANYEFQVGGLPSFNDFESIANENLDSIINVKINNPLSSMTANKGYAFDFGASARLGNFLQVGLSVLDLGSIRWKSDAYKYTAKGDFTFEGLDVAGFLTGQNVDDIGSIGDTLTKVIDLTSVAESYSAPLNTKIYITGRLKFGKELYLNGVLRNEFTPAGVQTGFGVGLQKHLGLLSLGMMYSIQNGSFANIGANAALKLGFVQIYVVGDNFLPVVNQWQAANANIRAGVNLTFNDKKKEDKEGDKDDIKLF